MTKCGRIPADKIRLSKTAGCSFLGIPVINSAAAWDNESGLNAGYGRSRYYFRRSVNFVDTSVKRGEIYYADLSPVVGSEQGGVRPVLIIQNDTGNRYSPTVIAAAITSQTGKARLPTHIELPVEQECGLTRDSLVLLEQVRTLDKRRLRERMGRVDDRVMEKIDTAIAVSFGLSQDRLV